MGSQRINRTWLSDWHSFQLFRHKNMRHLWFLSPVYISVSRVLLFLSSIKLYQNPSVAKLKQRSDLLLASKPNGFPPQSKDLSVDFKALHEMASIIPLQILLLSIAYPILAALCSLLIPTRTRHGSTSLPLFLIFPLPRT